MVLCCIYIVYGIVINGMENVIHQKLLYLLNVNASTVHPNVSNA